MLPHDPFETDDVVANESVANETVAEELFAAESIAGEEEGFLPLPDDVLAPHSEFADVLIVDEDEEDLGPSIAERGSIAAAVASAIFHVWLIVTLSSIAFTERIPPYEPPIQTRLESAEVVDEPEQIIEYELANPLDIDHPLHEAINARSVGAAETREAKVESAPVPLTELVSLKQAKPLYDIPEGLELDDSVVVKGTTGEAVVQIEAALDRVTWEIATNLKERKVLVVWLVDASGSLIEQRQQIARRLHRIYGELEALEVAGQIPNRDQPLLSSVVSFGSQINYLAEPTTDVNELTTAMASAPTDETGVENVFGAFRLVLRKWQEHRTKQGRTIMVITVTDEAGDDFAANLEPAIVSANRLGAKAYVIGPAATFGRRQGFVPYVAPEDGRTYQLPVDIGPETAVAENVQLPFWYDGPQFTYISSGLGPYALARLVRETGGVYFMTSLTTSSGLAPTGTYYSEDMKFFTPDYQFGSLEEYQKDIIKHPLRVAVVEAAARALKYPPRGTPQLEFRVQPTNYLQTLSTAQQTVAESTLMIDNILEAFRGNLESEYAKEDSPRWRAAYNLSLGRLLAQKVRCYEYNFACAQLKQLGTQDVATKSNRWHFRPDANLNYAVSLRKLAQEADKLLRRVIEEAPGTPWAVLASRELKDPFGIKIIEQFEPPPTPRTQTTAPARRRGMLLLAPDPAKKVRTKPAPPPKPPALPKL